MIGLAALTAPAVLAAAADPTGGQAGGQGQEFGSSSPVALVVLILFFVAVGFLARSMSKHLKRVPDSFDPPERPAGPEDASADQASTGGVESTKPDA